jgi:hypothetical protein
MPDKIYEILPKYQLFMCQQALNLSHFFLGKAEFQEVENKKITQQVVQESKGEERKESAQETKNVVEKIFLPSSSPSSFKVQNSHQPQPTAKAGGRRG